MDSNLDLITLMHHFSMEKVKHDVIDPRSLFYFP